MIERIGRTKYHIYAMDVESHNDPESIEKGETSIWLGCLINETNTVDDESSYFYTIEEFLSKCEFLTRPHRTEKGSRKCCNLAIYIYNLSFEWSFILPVLISQGFTFNAIIDKKSAFNYNSVSTKSVSSVWTASFKFGKTHGVVVLRDLAKIYSGGLDKVAKSFNLPTQKGSIDYRLNRLHDYTVTKEEKEYCFKDTRIIIDILEKIVEQDDKTFWNIISMASYSMKLLVKEGYPRSTKPYQEFRKGYPELSEEENRFLRETVEGGICYAPKRFQFVDIKQKIVHIDAHQMHPSSAYLHLFPYGEGEYFTGKPLKNRICACRIRITYYDVKLYSNIKLIGLPFITDKEITVWDFEIPTMYKCYEELEIEYIDGYAYQCKPLPWRRFYANNYRLRKIAKENKDSYNVLRYKLLNNSSYGKLLEKPHNAIFKNIINKDGIIDSEEESKEELRYNAKYTYLPVGSCIPAYSRVCLIELAFKIGWEKIVYFDTDSIFFLLDDETWSIWNTVNQEDFLGGWALEEIIDRAMFTAPKRYKTETDGELSVKAGGINFKKYLYDHGLEEKDITKVPFDEINIISSEWDVQRAYRVKGGTIIDFQKKEIKIPKKYEDIYNKNKKKTIE